MKTLALIAIIVVAFIVVMLICGANEAPPSFIDKKEQEAICQYCPYCKYKEKK